MILLDQSGRDQVRAQYAGRLEPVEAVPGFYFLPERLIAEFDGLDAYPTGDLLENAKSHRISQLAGIRWLACQTFSYDGESEAYAAPAQSWLASTIAALDTVESPSPVSVKLSQSTFRTMTVNELRAYHMAAVTHVQQCFENEHALMIAIEGALTLDALQAVSITEGWP